MRPYLRAVSPSGRSAAAALLLLLIAVRHASSATQTVGPEVAFVRLGDGAVCGSAVSGHTLLCFDPSTPVPIGFGATLRVTQTNFTVALGATTVTVSAGGATTVNGADAGPAGSVSIAGAVAGHVDGVWLVRRETLLAPTGAVQDVCVVGTTVCGLRLILAPDEPSIAVVAGSRIVIDDDITLPIVMAALAADTHIVSRWNVFSAQQHAQLVLPVDVPVDGSSALTLRRYAAGSTCGNAYYRHEQRVTVGLNECVTVTDELRAAMDLSDDYLSVRFGGCPLLGVIHIRYSAFRELACANLGLANEPLALGVCSDDGTSMFECRSAL
jgi:hypothetical protein